MSNRPTASLTENEAGKDTVGLRVYLERIIDERDQRYEDRFKAQEAHLTFALEAAKELTGAAFSAAKEAVAKSEIAQSAYNQRSNEFRQSLDDQNKIQMPRVEADGKFKTLDDKVEEVRKGTRLDADIRYKSIDDKIEELRKGTLRTVLSAAAIALSIITLLVMYFKH